jgi:putative transposase
VNKFPDFVRHIVCRLKVLHPTFGKKRIAQLLARAGLHIGVTTVRRMLKQGPAPAPKGRDDQVAPVTGEQALAEAVKRPNKPVKSKYPDHVWQVDLTLVATTEGFWVPWLPFTLPQQWPFCWWVACVVDHFSRRVVGFAVFAKQPRSVDVRCFMGRVIATWGQPPKYIISDLGAQFDNDEYRSWCEGWGIMYRYSSADSLGATAVIERFFRSLKEEMLRRGDVPLRRDELRALLTSYIIWFNERRPHQGLGGRTPNEVCFGRKPANEKARIEPRAQWPRKSPCALPAAAQRGRSGRVVDLAVHHHDADTRLPIVELRPAA